MRGDKLWIAGVVGVLAVTVIGNFWVLHIADQANGMAIEKDYYHKAVMWDSTMAQVRRNGALGWRVEAEMTPLDAEGFAWLTVHLADRTGRPIAGASVSTEAIHNLRADRPVDAALPGTADGDYSARLKFERPGLWELRLEARRGADRFTADLRRELGVARP